jgi:excinuclease ABC subunit C
MPIGALKAEIDRLPAEPGVYIFLNRRGETLYVGKARSLRDRVRTYLTAYGTSPRHDALLDEVDRLDVIVTDSAVEALALENHLIKQRGPRYNILLRDDKNYPYLQLTTTEPFPRLLVARRVERDGNFYAGPFLPASLARRTMALTHRLFGLRSCNETITGRRERPCIEYDIKRCLAPCVAALCPPEEYARAVARAKLFLEGRAAELVATLKAQMQEAAAAERFERAAQLRDALRTVEALVARQQKVATTALGDRDAFGLKLGPAGAVIEVFQMRRGRVVDRVELVAEEADTVGRSEADVLQAALQQFYDDRPAPAEVHVPVALEDAELLERWLSERSGERVRIVVPKRGDKRGLLELAARNAALAYERRVAGGLAGDTEAVDSLQRALRLPVRPRRIEAFDVSTIQGRDTVAAVVVAEDGRLQRSEYRKFRIRTVGPSPDDFAAMREVVGRRYRRLLEEGGPFPDLVVIDGGKGQLSAAYAALEALGLGNLVAVGLAKKEELLYTRDDPAPLRLPLDSPALHLVQRLRDEAHRFAVSFHRRARAMRDLRSELDEVPGIGPRRRQALLARFGSAAAVRQASRDELVAVVGARVADALLAHFAQRAGR